MIIQCNGVQQVGHSRENTMSEHDLFPDPADWAERALVDDAKDHKMNNTQLVYEDPASAFHHFWEHCFTKEY